MWRLVQGVEDLGGDQPEQLSDRPAASLDLELARFVLSHCVQGAVAKIQDNARASERKTHRIRLLLNSLHDFCKYSLQRAFTYSRMLHLLLFFLFCL
jgi:hypothetical protein